MHLKKETYGHGQLCLLESSVGRAYSFMPRPPMSRSDHRSLKDNCVKIHKVMMLCAKWHSQGVKGY